MQRKVQVANEWKAIQDRLSHAPLSYDALYAAREHERILNDLKETTVLQHEVLRVRNRIKRSNRGLLEPTGTFMQCWDLLMLLALLFTVIVTPYEVGYGYGPDFAAANWIVTATFGAGMVVEFFLIYRLPHSQGGSKVKDHKLIAKRYLKSWFFIDLISTVPWDGLAAAMQGGGADGEAVLSSGEQAAADVAKMLRLMRLLKLMRIIRASRVVNRLTDRLENIYAVRYAVRSVVGWTVILLIFRHWFCCVWGLIAVMRSTQRTAELQGAALDAGCEPGPGACLSLCEADLLANQTGVPASYIWKQGGWLCHAIADGSVSYVGEAPGWSAYLYTQSEPHKVSRATEQEALFMFVLSFFDMILNTCYLGVVAKAFAESDPFTREFKRRMDHLNHFLRDTKAPDVLKRRTRQHLRDTKDLVARQSFNDLYPLFSPRLRTDILAHMSLRTLRAVNYFAECEVNFLRELILRMKRLGFEKGERIIHAETSLSLVTRGTAVLAGRPITLHQYWGSDFIVTSKRLRDNRNAAALTYLEIVCLTRSDLLAVIHTGKYEESVRIVHMHALAIATNRAAQIIGRYLKGKGLTPPQQAAFRRASLLADSQEKTTMLEMKQEVAAFGAAMANLGKHTHTAHKEYQYVLRTLNDGVPLLGLAHEQRHSCDSDIREQAEQAICVEGEDAPLVVSEEGVVYHRSGRKIDVDELDGFEGEKEGAAGTDGDAVRDLRDEMRESFRAVNLTLARLARKMETAHTATAAADGKQRLERASSGKSVSGTGVRTDREEFDAYSDTSKDGPKRERSVVASSSAGSAALATIGSASGSLSAGKRPEERREPGDHEQLGDTEEGLGA